MAKKTPETRAKVLALLTNLEIDRFVLGQLAAIPEITRVLEEIISKPGKADAYQVQNAAYDDQSLRVAALGAIRSLKPDRAARKQLRQFIRQDKIDAPEKTRARLALHPE